MRLALVALVLSVSAATAAAQDQLTPTDVLAPTEAFVTARFQAGWGDGEISLLGITGDLEFESMGIILEGGYGIADGLEAEFAIPFVINESILLGDEDDGIEQEADGLGDLELGLVYDVLFGQKSTTRWVVGGRFVLPTGDDDTGQEEITVGGVTLQEGEDAGIGDGTWKAGFLTAVSFPSGTAEPYFAFSYLFAGEAEEDDVETDVANVAEIIAGCEFAVSPTVKLDVRASFEFVGEEVEEDEFGAESTEEAYLRYGLQAQIYAQVGDGITLVAGAGANFVQDHALDEESDIELEELTEFVLTIGFHWASGGRPAGRRR